MAPNVASVAFVVCKQAANELPRFELGHTNVRQFLSDWADRSYTDQYDSGLVRRKKFGLSRATTLLHALSKGTYPIFDSRVRAGYRRLTGQSAKNNVNWYLDSYVEFFLNLAKECGTTDLKFVDNALFAYGRKQL